MPPPSLSTTTMRRSAPRRGERRQRAAVVDEGDVADEGDRRPRRRAPRRAPSTRRRRSRWPPGWRGPSPSAPPNHSRSRTGIDEATTSSASGREVAGDRPGDGRLAERRLRAEHVVDRRLGQCGGGEPAVAPRPVADAVEQLAERRQHRRSEAGDDAVIGVDDTGPADLHERCAGRGDPLGEDLRRRRAADAHDDVGPQLGGQPVGGGAGRRTRRRRRRASAGRDVGSASTGQPVAASERLDDLAPRRPSPAGEDHAAPVVEQRQQRADVSRPPATVWACGSGPARRQRARAGRRAARGTAG